MSNDDGKRSQNLINLMFRDHLKITSRVIGLSLIPIAFFGGGGYLLDKQFLTTPLFTFLGLIIAFIVAQIAVYKTMNELTRKQ